MSGQREQGVLWVRRAHDVQAIALIPGTVVDRPRPRRRVPDLAPRGRVDFAVAGLPEPSAAVYPAIANVPLAQGNGILAKSDAGPDCRDQTGHLTCPIPSFAI